MGQVAPEVQGTLLRLNEIVKQRDIIQSETIDAMEKTEKVIKISQLLRVIIIEHVSLLLFLFVDRSLGIGWVFDI